MEGVRGHHTDSVNAWTIARSVDRCLFYTAPVTTAYSHRKVYPTKASQHEFLATCIDVDVEKNVKHAHWHKYTRKRGHKATYFIPHCGARRRSPLSIALSCASSNSQLCAQKCDHLQPPPPPGPTFLKRPFLTDFKKYTHTPHPPQGNEILAHRTKSSEKPGKVP